MSTSRSTPRSFFSTRSAIDKQSAHDRRSQPDSVGDFSKYFSHIPRNSSVNSKYGRHYESIAEILSKKHPDFYEFRAYPSEGHVLSPKLNSIITEGAYKSRRNYASREHERKTAGMKIFASVLLNAWRRRRKEIKQLSEKVEYLKRLSVKSRNQIQFYNNLFRGERRRNDELTCHLKHSVEGINQAKTSCDNLATSLISLKADKAVLEQELQLKYKDYDTLHAVFAKTKGELFNSLVEQRVLESNIAKERRSVKYLEEQKNKLIDEISELRNENDEMEQKFHEELDRRDMELSRATEKIKFLESGLGDLKEKALKVEEYSENDAYLQNEVLQLQQQVSQLEKSINNSVDTRLRSWWSNVKNCQKTACNVAHIFTHYLLPATPPPTRMEISLDRILNYR